MAQHLERHPGVRATVNLVPSLIKQLDEYLDGSVFDPVVHLMENPTSTLSDTERHFAIEHFFLANPSTVIERSPRYRHLFARWSDGDKAFSEQELRDLAIHYSLAWTGEINRRREPWRSLVEKDRDYTEEDRQTLVAAQRAAVAEVAPLHKRLAQQGQIELSTTPFYHPILPLVVDTNAARESIRDVSLPLTRFAHPDDALLQLMRARQVMNTRFGLNVQGLWPSEGSVSDAALGLAARAQFTWAATDEGVLERSLAARGDTEGTALVRGGFAKYVPWKFETPHGPLTLFFRDHRFSDNIGFTYQGWNARDAVTDLVRSVEAVRAQILDLDPDILPTACVSIILDGENCWEYYPNNGFEFLDTLYTELENSSTIQTCTFSEVARDSSAYPSLEHVVAGSWINSNFRIWLGHPEDNAAWDALGDARRALAEFEQRVSAVHTSRRAALHERLEQAREHILIAEGSDWCWWYGDEHYSAQRGLFDAIFRQHLRAVYVLIDRAVPEELLVPIIDRPDLADRYRRPSQREARPGEVPQIAGKLLNDSWIGIPNSAPPKVFGAMHRSFDREIEDLRIVRVGGDVLVRLILSPAIPERGSIVLSFDRPTGLLVRFTGSKVELTTPTGVTKLRGFRDETLECALPASLLRGTKTVRLKLEIRDANGRVTTIPEEGTIECDISETESSSSPA
jgi:alpha-amylase/alpha-mannosidase (GH57 family)